MVKQLIPLALVSPVKGVFGVGLFSLIYGSNIKTQSLSSYSSSALSQTRAHSLIELARDILVSQHVDQRYSFNRMAVAHSLKHVFPLCARFFAKKSFGASPFKDMGMFLKSSGFGSELREGSQKTRVRIHGASVYKSQKWINEYIRDGDLFYIDTFHLDHIEVFDVKGKARAVLNLDGTLNVSKTAVALKQGRMIPK
jgi:hypothetical protein